MPEERFYVHETRPACLSRASIEVMVLDSDYCHEVVWASGTNLPRGLKWTRLKAQAICERFNREYAEEVAAA